MFEFGVTIRLPIQLNDRQKSRIRQQAISAVKSYMPGNAEVELTPEAAEAAKPEEAEPCTKT